VTLLKESFPFDRPSSTDSGHGFDKLRRSLQPLKLLLVASDSLASTAAVDLLTHITWPARTSVHLLTAVPEQLPQMEPSVETRSGSEEALELSRWRDWAVAESFMTRLAILLQAHKLAVETEICEGSLVEVALKRSDEILFDLIVIGATGFEEVGKHQVDPAAQKLLDEANCSVLVVRPTAQVRPLSVILAIDESSIAWQAVEFLQALTLANWAKVTVLNVIEEVVAACHTGARVTKEGIPAELSPEEYLRLASESPLTGKVTFGQPDTYATEVVRYLRDEGVQGREAIRVGQPAPEILGVAREREAVLIVMGAYSGKRQIPFRLGSVAQKVVGEAPCSVLVVR
jgi:nucleotide-binding universal stress UspA family protein